MDAAGGRVAWIATAPVKGLRLALRDEAVLERTGIEGDRAEPVR